MFTGPVDYTTARLVAKGVADALAPDLVNKGMLMNRLTFAVGYDIGSLDLSKPGSCADCVIKRAAEWAAKSYQGSMIID